LVFLPLGALEEHGPHLPLMVDWIGAEELARRIAPHVSRAGWRPVLAPSLPYGVSALCAEWPGTVSLSRATLARVIVEVVQGLARHGFRRFVLTNYQADPGHLAAMASARRRLGRGGRLQVLFAGFTPDVPNAAMLSPRVTALLRSPQPRREWHSGELETAMMLSVASRLVRRDVARRLRPLWIDIEAARARGARTFREMAPRGRGYFGSPRVARADTGRRAMALRGRLIAAQLLAALGAPPTGTRARSRARGSRRQSVRRR
jgi:creatinine amidohydrolase